MSYTGIRLGRQALMLEGISTVILLISLTGLLLSDFHVDTVAQTNAELKHCLRYRATYRQAYKHILGIPSTPERLMEPAPPCPLGGMDP